MLLLFSVLQHDAITNYKDAEITPSLVPSPPSFPCNMHLKRTSIAPHLHLLALGGSVPGYQGGEHLWDGFPYKTYAEMDADLHKLLDPVFFEDTSDLTPEDCVILMTHSGPAECGMCVMYAFLHLCVLLQCRSALTRVYIAVCALTLIMCCIDTCANKV